MFWYNVPIYGLVFFWKAHFPFTLIHIFGSDGASQIVPFSLRLYSVTPRSSSLAWTLDMAKVTNILLPSYPIQLTASRGEQDWNVRQATTIIPQGKHGSENCMQAPKKRNVLNIPVWPWICQFKRHQLPANCCEFGKLKEIKITFLRSRLCN